MRILVELKALSDAIYDNSYYHKLQGFLYGLLSDTPHNKLHEKSGCKYFSFSNIFPYSAISTGSVKNMLISSPDEKLIENFLKKLNALLHNGNRINIGEMSFLVSRVLKLDTMLKAAKSLITGTPIVLRIPKEKFTEYGINSEGDHPSVYWRPEHSFNAFIKQLNENLIKKYNGAHDDPVDNLPLFDGFVFKKSVCTSFVKGGRDVKVIGSLWEFPISYLDYDKKRVLEFGLDAGFGELNSLGFGFMNVRR